MLQEQKMENNFLLCLDGPSLSFNFDDKMRQKSTTKAAKKFNNDDDDD